MKKVIFFVLLIMILSPLLAQDFDDLTYLTENYFPFNYVDSNRLTGMSVELLKLMWEYLDVPPQPIRILPWARAFHTLKTQKNVVLFATARSIDREALFKWVGPIFESHYVLIGLENSPDLSASDLINKDIIVGALMEDVGNELLLDTGFPKEKIIVSSNVESLFAQLNARVVDYIVYSEVSADAFLSAQNSSLSVYNVSHILANTSAAYAFSPNVSDDIINQYQSALDHILSQPIYNELLHKFFYQSQ